MQIYDFFKQNSNDFEKYRNGLYIYLLHKKSIP